VPEVAAVAEEVTAEVEIARIQAERDVQVARIQAKQDKDWNETHVQIAEVEAEAEVASAEATAEVIGEVIAAEAGNGDPEPADDPAPIVISAEPEDDSEQLPPPVAETHDSGPAKKPAWGFS
jgi:hypothetical protein